MSDTNIYEQAEESGRIAIRNDVPLADAIREFKEKHASRDLLQAFERGYADERSKIYAPDPLDKLFIPYKLKRPNNIPTANAKRY